MRSAPLIGIFAAARTQAKSAIEGNTSRIRCASTLPMNACQRPGRSRFGIRRMSTPMRATSPTRPGRTPFAKIPTKNAEMTSTRRGCGGGTASLITLSHDIARASAESEVQRDRDGGPAPAHLREVVPDLAPVRAVEDEERYDAGARDGDEARAEEGRAAERH